MWKHFYICFSLAADLFIYNYNFLKKNIFAVAVVFIRYFLIVLVGHVSVGIFNLALDVSFLGEFEFKP